MKKYLKVLIVVMAIFILGIVIVGSIKYKSAEEKNLKRASAMIKEQNEKIIEMQNKDTDFMKALRSGQTTKITFVGDSITEGVGASGHISPPPNKQPKIFDDGAGNVFYEALYTDNTWTNLFRKYITVYFHNVQVVNKGISGKSAKWANTNKQYLIGSEDVVFVMLGTNDRWDCKDINEYKVNLEQFLAYTKNKSKTMIVLSPPPALNDYKDDTNLVIDPTYKFTTKDIDATVADICTKNGYKHISLYKAISNYATDGKVELKTLLQARAVGSHPLDLGYNVIWGYLVKDLGLRELFTSEIK